MRLTHSMVLLLSLAAGSLLAGCATHTANNKTQTVILGGLVEVKEGVYERETITGIALNPDQPLPGSKLTGNKVSLFWGLISYRDQ